jgi:hypothetical protein
MYKLSFLLLLIITGCSTNIEDVYNNDCDCLKVKELYYTERLPNFIIKNCENVSKILYVDDWGYYNINTCLSPYSKTNQIVGFPYHSLNIEIYTNLPVYNALKYTKGYFIIKKNNIIIVNNGYDYRAFDLISPNNHNILLKLVGNKLVCSETKKEYLIFTGKTSSQEFSIKEYFVEKIGKESETLTIKN